MRYSLFLYPHVTAESRIIKSELIDTLAELDFLQRSESSQQLSGGPQLMDFITFLGCSPALESAEIRSVILLHQFDQINALGGEAIDAIRYPGCKHLLRNSADLISDYPALTLWICPECGQQGAVEDINWRKSAGFSTLFIEISPIFPKEAIPSDRLLSVLNETTQSSWHWFYSKSSVRLDT
ncbi:MAG: hypothetical protein H8E21_10650 [Gammaproteobacteria bacterium]|nr:hypothetical protein [Gammaproteobacteria bacterium]